MCSDPTTNLVAFEVEISGRLEKLIGRSQTRSSHCIRSAWEQVSQEQNLRPEQVRQLYSEWQPSEEDISFIRATFVDEIPVTYSFERPVDGDWDRAFRETAEIINGAMNRHRKEKRPWWRFWS